MSRHKLNTETGFTIAELTIAIVLIGIVSTTMFSFFNTSISQYFGLQANATEFTDLASNSQRLANVLRGTTDIVTPNSNDITVYAYFAPNNNYVSLISYYLGDNDTKLYADVTPMTANPPNGTPVTANKRTFVVIDHFSKSTSVGLFEYLDANGGLIAMPVADQRTIKNIRINLGVPAVAPNPNSTQNMSLTVSLRNRKTNL